MRQSWMGYSRTKPWTRSAVTTAATRSSEATADSRSAVTTAALTHSPQPMKWMRTRATAQLSRVLEAVMFVAACGHCAGGFI